MEETHLSQNSRALSHQKEQEGSLEDHSDWGVLGFHLLNPLDLWLENSASVASVRTLCRASGGPRVGICHGGQAGAG